MADQGLIPALDSNQEIQLVVTGVSEVLDMFRAKYGARDVAAYYPKPNVAVEVPLT